MSTALALVAPHAAVAPMKPAPRQSSSPPPPPSSGVQGKLKAAAFVYGDSTPSPYDFECLATIRASVKCAVQLVHAENIMAGCRARISELDQRAGAMRTRVALLAGAAEKAILAESHNSPEITASAAAAIVLATRNVAQEEIRKMEATTAVELAKLRDTSGSARQQCWSAIEALLSKHEFPGSRVMIRVMAREQGYGAEATVATPFGLRATFDLPLPPDHFFTRARRVGELVRDVRVHVPKEVGWISQRVERRKVSLDRYFVLGFSASEDRGMLILARTPDATEGYECIIDSQGGEPRIFFYPLKGNADAPREPAELTGEDKLAVVGLHRALANHGRGLLASGRRMTAMEQDGKPLGQDAPLRVARRLVDAVSGPVADLAAHSGAPGELVLRRNVGSGRRDEVFLTKAELSEGVSNLPSGLRWVFDALELDIPRSLGTRVPSDDYEDVETHEIFAVR